MPRMNWLQTHSRQLLSAGAAVLVVLAVTVELVVTSGGQDNGRPTTVTVTVNSKAGDGLPTQKLEVPAAAVERAAVTEDHSHLGTVPDPAMVEPIRQAIRYDRSVPLATGGAVIGFKGCVTRILPANYSSRPGVRPRWFVLHYTVSRNVAGWGDVNAIIGLFSNPSRQASSNFVLDAEGHCAYIVPIEAKAWTQAGGNPWSISVEVIAYGNEANYLGPAGYRQLKSIVDQVHRRTGIPLRGGSVAGGCVPGRPGLVQHKDFGLCGGGHVDITPFSSSAVIRAVTGPVVPPNPLTKAERRLVSRACHPNGTGHSAVYWRGRARRRAGVLAHAAHRHHSWKYHHAGARRARLARAAAGCGKKG